MSEATYPPIIKTNSLADALRLMKIGTPQRIIITHADCEVCAAIGFAVESISDYNPEVKTKLNWKNDIKFMDSECLIIGAISFNILLELAQVGVQFINVCKWWKKDGSYGFRVARIGLNPADEIVVVS